METIGPAKSEARPDGFTRSDVEAELRDRLNRVEKKALGEAEAAHVPRLPGDLVRSAGPAASLEGDDSRDVRERAQAADGALRADAARDDAAA